VGEVGFDYETTSPKHAAWIHDAEIVGYSVSTKSREALYIPSKPPPEMFDHRLVCHNAKFEITQSRHIGHEIENFEDTKLAAYMLGYTTTGLKDLTKQLLGVDPITYQEATGGKDMSEMPPSEIVAYAAGDADHTLRLWAILSDSLRRNGLYGLYEDVEKPLVPILASMEARGILVDRVAAEDAAQYFEQTLGSARFDAHLKGRIPWTINVGSADQLGPWLKDQGAPIKEYTEVKKLPTTNANHLRWMAEEGWRPDIIALLLDYKEKKKLHGFPVGFLDKSEWDGLLHPSINQCGYYEEGADADKDVKGSPATGRLSMSTPNLQQIPHHGRGKGVEYEGYGEMIRRCLVARPGYTFMLADFAQQEPRILAVVANEPALLADFDAGIPIYAPMGEAIYGRTISKSTDQSEWHVAKTFFLALTYGADWDKLVEIDPRLTKLQAKAGYAKVAKRYRGLKAFGDGVKEELHRYGYVRDYFGRVRWLPGVFSPTRPSREASYREAINMKVQGPAATITKIAMRRAYEETADMDAHLLFTTHDEVGLEVKDELVREVAPILARMGEGLMPIDLPVEIKVGRNLGELEDIGVHG
jgi:DNA polymerase-1